MLQSFKNLFTKPDTQCSVKLCRKEHLENIPTCINHTCCVNGCNRLKDKYKLECDDHTCHYNDGHRCDKPALNRRYCSLHTCLYPDCTNQSFFNSHIPRGDGCYCIDHTCQFYLCDESIVPNSKGCRDHKCAHNSCGELSAKCGGNSNAAMFVDNGKYCSEHYMPSNRARNNPTRNRNHVPFPNFTPHNGRRFTREPTARITEERPSSIIINKESICSICLDNLFEEEFRSYACSSKAQHAIHEKCYQDLVSKNTSSRSCSLCVK